MKDFLGREYKIGNYFVMPVRRGSFMFQKIGRVVGFKTKKSVKEWDNNTYPYPVIRTIDYDRLTGRNAVMECPERAIMVRSVDVPGWAFNLLLDVVPTNLSGTWCAVKVFDDVRESLADAQAFERRQL